MSYKNSNLYASRVFAEHPLALWSFDESFYYYSLISDNIKTINSSDWTISNASIVSSFIAPSENPIEDSAISKLFLSASSSFTVEITSDPISYQDYIDSEKGSVCFNWFINVPKSTTIDYIKTGFVINGTFYGKTYNSFTPDSWEKLEFTKDLTTEDDIYLKIQINYNDSTVPDENNSSIYIAGVSAGQWSEPFNSINTGTVSVNLPENMQNLISSGSVVKGIALDPYGFNDQDTGYAIEYDKRLLAETSGIPMVYGSKNNISVYYRKNFNYFEEYLDLGSASSSYSVIIDGGTPSESGESILDGGLYNYFEESNNPKIPSLIFPGKGFFNRSGIRSELTAEFWVRINNESTTPVRIFGPVTSEDGVYVDREFITLKVGKYVKSYFIGQWYRPMLVHVGQKYDEIFLMINSEKVISIEIDSLDIPTFTNEDEDFLGFYGDEKIHPFDIDSFSIFPYTVSEEIAKIRFVYGQGVENQEIITTSFGGDLTYVDFPYAGYNSTVSYPDRTSWSSAFFNNLKADAAGLTLPEYSLPEIVFKSSDLSLSTDEVESIYESFEEDNYLIQDELYSFIKLSPNSTYNSLDSSILFTKLNKTVDQVKSVYAVLKTSSDVSSEQSLLYFSNISNLNTFESKIISGSIQYLYNNNILFEDTVLSNSELAVGIDFDKALESFPEIGSFFENPETISLNFAGSGSNAFLGKIFSLTLNNSFFTEKDLLLNEQGFADKDFTSDKYSYVGSYSLVPKKSNSTVFFDVASSGYWESSIPLSYFGKYVKDESGNLVYDLDLIQLNIDIPTTLYSKENTDSIEFASATGTKVFLTLQKSASVGLVPYTEYVNNQVINNDRVVDLNTLSASTIYNTKFEVCDSSIIIPPKSLGDFNDYNLTTHIVVTSKGINTENVRIKKMSLAGLSLNKDSENLIKSPTGRSFGPTSKNQGAYIYDSIPPMLVNNESAPYLYLTGNSGTFIPSNYSSGYEDFISFKINENLKKDFENVAIQAYLMFSEEDIFTASAVFAKVISDTREYDLIIEPEADGKRSIISVVDSYNGLPLEGIRFFQNGNEVSKIAVKPMEWNSVVISLQDNSINLSEKSGYFEVYPGVRVENVAFFTDINEISTNLTVSNSWDDIQSSTWGDVLSGSTSYLNWGVLLNEEIIPVVLLSVDGRDLFETYAGISFAVGDDSSILSVNFDSINVLNDATWTNFDIKPI